MLVNKNNTMRINKINKLLTHVPTYYFMKIYANHYLYIYIESEIKNLAEYYAFIIYRM